MLPAPVLACITVIKVHRPAVGYGLSDRVDAVGDLQPGQDLLELVGQLLGREAHGVDVVGAHAQRLGRSLHHLQRGPEAVGDVHHGQPRVGTQVALKLTGLHCVMEDLHSIVYKYRDHGGESEYIRNIRSTGIFVRFNVPDQQAKSL